jgi:hypothetical protein
LASTARQISPGNSRSCSITNRTEVTSTHSAITAGEPFGSRIHVRYSTVKYPRKRVALYHDLTSADASIAPPTKSKTSISKILLMAYIPPARYESHRPAQWRTHPSAIWLQ